MLAEPEKTQGKVLVGVSHPDRKLNLPTAVTIPLNGLQAGGLYFLHTGSWLGRSRPVPIRCATPMGQRW